MSDITDTRNDIIGDGSFTTTSESQYGTWVSTQGAAEVAIVVAVDGTLIGGGAYLAEANDTATPVELYAHPLTADPSGTRLYGVFRPAAGFVTVGVNADDGAVVTYSIRVTRYL